MAAQVTVPLREKSHGDIARRSLKFVALRDAREAPHAVQQAIRIPFKDRWRDRPILGMGPLRPHLRSSPIGLSDEVCPNGEPEGRGAYVIQSGNQSINTGGFSF